MNNDPVILHLESATKVCSVALTCGSEILAIRETAEGNRHSEWMTTFIEDVLHEASIQYNDLHAISVSQGPGSYTGLRVAYSVAKGMAYSLNIPMIGVPSLLSLAHAYIYSNASIPEKTIILPMIDARRMEVYTLAIDSSGQEQTALHAHILESDSFNAYSDYDHIILVGDGAFKVRDVELEESVRSRIEIKDDIISSGAHLRYAALKQWKAKDFLDVAYCVPEYLKSPNITQSKKKMLG